MEDLVSDLPESAWVLDLGAGPGSFRYASTRARIVALDRSFPAEGQVGAGRIIAGAEMLPIASGVVDVAICNHSLEHIDQLGASLSELDRVLKTGAKVWVAVPDGTSWDDAFYRFLFAGGGHFQRFSFQGLVGQVERKTRLRLIRYKTLRTGLVYLNPPAPEKVRYYPRRARILLGVWPAGWLVRMVRWGNYLIRVVDGTLHTHLSRYGWGFVFEVPSDSSPGEPGDSSEAAELPEDLNVCFGCGAGHPEETLRSTLSRWLRWNFYTCPGCKQVNVYFGKHR